MYLKVNLLVRLGERVEEAGQFNYSTSFQTLPLLFSQRHHRDTKFDPNGAKCLFFEKIPQCLGALLCPQTPECDTRELHQFAQHVT